MGVFTTVLNIPLSWVGHIIFINVFMFEFLWEKGDTKYKATQEKI